MKKSNLFLCLILAALVACGWFVQLSSAAKTQAQLQGYIQQGDEQSALGLYQNAIGSYEKALDIKENKSARESWIQNYELAYKEGTVSMKDYAKALETMCGLYEDDATYWERRITLYLEHERMDDAHECYEAFRRKKLSSSVIDGYANEIMYALKASGKSFSEVVQSTDGSFSVRDNWGWGLLDSDGETRYPCEYVYVGPVNQNGEVLLAAEDWQRVYDRDNVIQAKLNRAYAKTGAYSDGLIPVCTDGRWSYLDCESGKCVHGPYERASNYQDGIAAVFDGKAWTLVDTEGKPVSDRRFTDVKLHQDGSYVYDGVMIAAADGAYGLYNADGTARGDFHAKDMDVYFGGNIAYRDGSSGKWGFVSKDGAVQVQPTFAGAKSASHDLAAVSNGTAWGFAGNDGEVVIDYQFLSAGYFTTSGSCVVSTEEEEYIVRETEDSEPEVETRLKYHLVTLRY